MNQVDFNLLIVNTSYKVKTNGRRKPLKNVTCAKVCRPSDYLVEKCAKWGVRRKELEDEVLWRPVEIWCWTAKAEETPTHMSRACELSCQVQGTWGGARARSSGLAGVRAGGAENTQSRKVRNLGAWGICCSAISDGGGKDIEKRWCKITFLQGWITLGRPQKIQRRGNKLCFL